MDKDSYWITFGAGLVMQFVYSLMHFEPRQLKHRDVIEVAKEIKVV